jgi:NRPS condensation-like uncharacterized protein
MSLVGKISESYSNKPYIQSLLKLLPYWGAPDTLLQKRADEIRIDRMRAFFDELAIGQHELTEDLIQSEDFLHCYFSTIKAALNTRRRDKIRMMARLLNSYLSPSMNTTTDEYEELLAVLDAISFREFNVLHSLYQLEQSNPGDENNLGNINKYWEEFKDKVMAEVKIPQKSLSAFMAKIERTGLYLRITGGFYDYEGDKGRTTPLFGRLLAFIKE